MTRSGTGSNAAGTDPQGPGSFARIELPPVPALRRPPLEHDPLERLRDEPPQQWQSPFPEPAPPTGYTYRVAPPPLAPMPIGTRSTVQPVAAPAPVVSAPTGGEVRTPNGVTATAPEPAVAGPPATEPDMLTGAPSPAAVALLGVLAALLTWASGMAFSAALLAMSALVIAELGRGLAAARTDGTTLVTKVAVGLSVLLGALAMLRGVGAMTGEGFVAGLFVLVALAPTLLVVGGVALVLRVRRQPTSGDAALRSGIRHLLVATLLLAAAGYHANATFAPTVDSLVAVVIGGFVILSAVRVLRDSRAR